MDSELDKSPGLAFSQAAPEQVSVSNGEHPGQVTEVASVASPAPSVVTQPVVAAPPPLSSSDPQAAASAVSAAGDDSDALDEEWVNKAKAIVERTRNDPFMESQELSKAKADYLRIRYNKQVKVAEDS